MENGNPWWRERKPCEGGECKLVRINLPSLSATPLPAPAGSEFQNAIGRIFVLPNGTLMGDVLNQVVCKTLRLKSYLQWSFGSHPSRFYLRVHCRGGFTYGSRMITLLSGPVCTDRRACAKSPRQRRARPKVKCRAVQISFSKRSGLIMIMNDSPRAAGTVRGSTMEDNRLIPRSVKCGLTTEPSLGG